MYVCFGVLIVALSQAEMGDLTDSGEIASWHIATYKILF